MTSARFAAIFAAIFFLGALPLVLVQSLGGAGAGLSAGLVLPLSHPWHILMFFAVGILASQLGSQSSVMLPTAFLTMLALGVFLTLDYREIPAAKFLILLAIVCFGVVANRSSLRAFLLSTLITAGTGFTLGSGYAATLPDIASPLYYLLGILVATCFMLVGGLCLGLSFSSFVRPLHEVFSLQGVTRRLQREWLRLLARRRARAAARRASNDDKNHARRTEGPRIAAKAETPESLVPPSSIISPRTQLN